MSRVKRPILPWYLLLVLVALVPTVTLIAVFPSYASPDRGIRATALMGYLFILFSVISANYVQPLVRRFGRPFITLHHCIAVTGLALITLHPVLLALTGRGLAVFVPVLTPWRDFWVFAGRPAWLLLIVAVSAARLRQRFKNGWRIVHGLTYVALFMGTVHGVLIGTSFVTSPLARAVMYLLLACGLAVLVHRRYQDWRRAQARAKRTKR